MLEIFMSVGLIKQKIIRRAQGKMTKHVTHIKHKACTLGLIILKYSSADLLLIVIETVFTDTDLQGQS